MRHRYGTETLPDEVWREAIKSDERNRIADALEAEASISNYDIPELPSVWVRSFTERLRKGEV